MSNTASPAAIHESGHTLVSFVYRRGPLKVELTGEETGKTSAIEYQDPTKKQIIEDIHIALAGPHAEFLQYGKSAGIDEDLENALNHLRKLNPKARLRDLQPYIRKLTDALSDPTTWPKIQALAEQLQQQRSLSFDEITKILRQDHPAARPPHAGARITLALNPHYRPPKITKAMAINKGNQPRRLYALQDLPI